MKNPRVWLWLTIAVIVVGVLIAIRYANTGGVSSASATAPPVVPLAQGQAAPEFTAATNHGYFDLAKTDKPVFLEVFATWCPHCQRETAILDRLYQTYGSRVAFVAVSGSNVAMDHTSQSSEQDVLSFVSQFDVRYPVAYDSTLDVANKYMQGGFPTLVVIGRDKKIVYAADGEQPYETLQQAIALALKSSSG